MRAHAISSGMSEHLTPLEVCQKLIGRIELIGEICECNEKAPYHWKRESGLHAAGDIRSARHMRSLLNYSESRGLGLTPRHLVDGASAAEVAAILEARGGASGRPSQQQASHPSDGASHLRAAS